MRQSCAWVGVVAALTLGACGGNSTSQSGFPTGGAPSNGGAPEGTGGEAAATGGATPGTGGARGGVGGTEGGASAGASAAPTGSGGATGGATSELCVTTRVATEAIEAAIESLHGAVAQIRSTTHSACRAIVTDLGNDVPAPSDPVPDDELAAMCDLATTAVGDAKAASWLTVAVAPGHCAIDAAAQLDCERDCAIETACDPATIDARCPPGALSGICAGECIGTLYCLGSASAPAVCEGACAGTCEGTCTGTCKGECVGTCSRLDLDGTCEGDCEGECRGLCGGECVGTCAATCEYSAGASLSCDGEDHCRGECSTLLEDPTCEAELEPPSCNLDADCRAGCAGLAQFNLDCSDPTVLATAGDADEFEATLEANLPALILVRQQAELFARAPGEVASRAASLAVDPCNAERAAELAAKASQAIADSATVSVALEAAARVLGEATSG